MEHSANFWLALITGAVVLTLLQGERFERPCYEPNLNEPLSRFLPSQLTTRDRYRKSKVLYVGAILAIYLLLALLGPSPLAQFNVKIIDPTSLPLYICAVFIGLSKISTIDRIETNLRSRFHKRAAIPTALSELSGELYVRVETKFGSTADDRIRAIIDLCQKAEEIIQNRAGVDAVDFNLLFTLKEEIAKLRRRASLLMTTEAENRERLAEELGFNAAGELRKVISILLVPFCNKAGFRQGLRNFLIWADLPGDRITIANYGQASTELSLASL